MINTIENWIDNDECVNDERGRILTPLCYIYYIDEGEMGVCM